MKALRYAASVAAVGAVIALYRFLPVNNTTVALTLLLVVLGVSARWGLAEATLASIVGMVAFNFFFLPPKGTLTIADPQNWVALAAFLVTAVTASQLSARVRRRAAEAESRRQEIEQLYELLQSLMLRGNPRKTIIEFVHSVVQVFGCTAAAVYYFPAEEVFRSGPESKVISDHILTAEAEVDSMTVDARAETALAPIRLGGRTLGSLGLVAPVPSPQTFRAIVNLLAITIEKAKALEDASHAEAAHQNEMLKSALLDSLAHDIRTPLTSIKAAVTSLLGSPDGPSSELLAIINEEADRLNDLSAEVVAMARIEAGKLHLDRRAVEIPDLIASTLAEFKGAPVKIAAEPDLPPADADAEFVQQVLKQLVDNAMKYSPAASPITILASRKGDKIVIGVKDQGPGIEENERGRIFDKFFRGSRDRFSTRGTGMGLAIAKGIVEAHREKIWVESEPGHGSIFYFSLPVRGGRE